MSRLATIEDLATIFAARRLWIHLEAPEGTVCRHGKGTACGARQTTYVDSLDGVL
jgi:hypothetical protein